MVEYLENVFECINRVFSLSCLTPLGGGPNLAASSFIRPSLFSVHPAKLAQILFIPILTNAVSSSQTSLITCIALCIQNTAGKICSLLVAPLCHCF